jgi:biopolymer transport protein ExbD
MDAIFIFVFFLLMSTTFVKLFEISSDVPLVAETPPPNQEKPLALTLSVSENDIAVLTGVPGQVIKRFGKIAYNKYDLESLHAFLVQLKKRNPDEKTAVIEPLFDIQYEDLVKIMDTTRLLRNTDELIFTKNKQGIDEKTKMLFDNIIFGNLLG